VTIRSRHSRPSSDALKLEDVQRDRPSSDERILEENGITIEHTVRAGSVASICKPGKPRSRPDLLPHPNATQSNARRTSRECAMFVSPPPPLRDTSPRGSAAKLNMAGAAAPRSCPGGKTARTRWNGPVTVRVSSQQNGSRLLTTGSAALRRVPAVVDNGVDLRRGASWGFRTASRDAGDFGPRTWCG